MSKLINETIEAFDLFSQGVLSEEDIYNGIQSGLISESLFDELAGAYLLEFELSFDSIKSVGQKLADKGKEIVDNKEKIIDAAKETAKNVGNAAKETAKNVGNTIKDKIDPLIDKPWYVDVANHLHNHAAHYGIGAAALGAAGAGYAAYKYLKNKKAKTINY